MEATRPTGRQHGFSASIVARGCALKISTALKTHHHSPPHERHARSRRHRRTVWWCTAVAHSKHRTHSPHLMDSWPHKWIPNTRTGPSSAIDAAPLPPRLTLLASSCCDALSTSIVGMRCVNPPFEGVGGLGASGPKMRGSRRATSRPLLRLQRTGTSGIGHPRSGERCSGLMW